MPGELEEVSGRVLLEEEEGVCLAELDEELDGVVDESVVSETELEVEDPVVPRDD